MDKITEERARACYIVPVNSGHMGSLQRSGEMKTMFSALGIQITLNGNISSPQPD